MNSYKSKHILTIWSSSHTHDIYLRKLKSYVHRKTCAQILNCQNLDTVKMANSRWINKWTVVHPDSETCSSVQFSRSVVPDSLRPHESQHARSPCPSPTPGVYSDSRPSSQWCHPAISSSVVPFSSCPQSLPASESLWVNSSHEVAKVLEFQL